MNFTTRELWMLVQAVYNETKASADDEPRVAYYSALLERLMLEHISQCREEGREDEIMLACAGASDDDDSQEPDPTN